MCALSLERGCPPPPPPAQVFKYLQVISAAAVSFAHGANDVANAVGPFAAIYGVYTDSIVSG